MERVPLSTRADLVVAAAQLQTPRLWGVRGWGAGILGVGGAFLDLDKNSLGKGHHGPFASAL